MLPLDGCADTGSIIRFALFHVLACTEVAWHGGIALTTEEKDTAGSTLTQNCNLPCCLRLIYCRHGPYGLNMLFGLLVLQRRHHLTLS